MRIRWSFFCPGGLFMFSKSFHSKFAVLSVSLVWVGVIAAEEISDWFRNSCTHGERINNKTTTTGLISNHGVSYDNSYCWLLLFGNTSVILFTVFNRNCENEDRVEIFDNYVKTPLLQSACDDIGEFGVTVKTTSNRALVRIVSSNTTTSSYIVNKTTGFEIQYTELASGSNESELVAEFYVGNDERADNKAKRGYIRNEGFPTNYFNSSHVTWHLMAAPGSVFKATLETYLLEECYNCQCDFVAVYNSATTSSQRMLSKSCFPTKQIYKTTSNELTIQFHSDSTITFPATESFFSGFQLQYEELEPSPNNAIYPLIICENQTISLVNGTTKGTISNAGLYENNTDCFWEVITSTNSKIRYSVQINWIEYCSNCMCDYLFVTDDAFAIAELPPYELRDCGRSSTSSPTLTTSNKLYVRFVTDGTVTAPSNERRNGFMISVEEVPNTLCTTINYVDSQRNSTIRNFEFPHAYHNNVRCQWQISVSYGAQIRLNVNVFWIDGCSNCSNCDRLAIYDSHTKSPSTLLTEICQSNQHVFLTTSTNLALIEFITDDENPELDAGTTAGFQLTYEEVWNSRAIIENGLTSSDSEMDFALLMSIVGSVVIVIIILVSVLISAIRLAKNATMSNFEVTLNNYLTPASNFQELLHELGNNELQRMVVRLNIEPAWLSLLEQIGSGNFGLVNKAKLQRPDDEQTMSEEVVAVKSLKSSRSEDVVDFLKEAYIMQGFQHPNVLPLLGIAILCDQPRVVVPFMENGNLRDYLHRPHSADYSEDELMHFCAQICSGMEYLADKRCIHRDLACRNILVAGDETLKISDFGMARLVKRDDCYRYFGRQQLLPVRWHPPESLLFNSFELKSDVWSFGIVMWEIFSLCESIPYSHLQNHLDVVHQVCNGVRPENPPRCPHNFYDEIMMPCWNMCRNNRPSFGELLTRIHHQQISFIEESAL